MSFLKSIEVPVSTEYVDWNIWECLRELIQNAKDEDENFNVKLINGDILCIKNKGKPICTSDLILGKTEKRDDEDSIGQFGEGLKLALIQLCKKDIDVIIDTPKERWIPTISESEAFGDKVLVINRYEQEKNPDNNTIFVHPVSKEKIKEVVRKTIFLNDKTEKLSHHGLGNIYSGEALKDNIYVKGLYCCNTSDLQKSLDLPHSARPETKLVYNLKYLVSLDRDRNAPKLSEIKRAVANIFWRSFDSKNKTVEGLSIEKAYDVLNSNSFTMEAVHENNIPKLPLGPSPLEKLGDEFIRRHGDGKVPVGENDKELKRKLTVYDIEYVEVDDKFADVLHYVISPEEAIQEETKNPEEFFNIEDLNHKEKRNLAEAIRCLGFEPKRGYETLNIQVVRFGEGRENLRALFKITENESVYGNCDSDRIPLGHFEILIDRSRLQSFATAVQTMIHEYAHRWGDDLTKDHVQQIESLWRDVVRKKVIQDGNL